MQNQINRLTTARNKIRDKLIALGMDGATPATITEATTGMPGGGTPEIGAGLIGFSGYGMSASIRVGFEFKPNTKYRVVCDISHDFESESLRVLIGNKRNEYDIDNDVYVDKDGAIDGAFEFTTLETAPQYGDVPGGVVCIDLQSDLDEYQDISAGGYVYIYELASFGADSKLDECATAVDEITGFDVPNHDGTFKIGTVSTVLDIPAKSFVGKDIKVSASVGASKTVTPSSSRQVITGDSVTLNGVSQKQLLKQVVVEPIPDDLISTTEVAAMLAEI